MNNTTLKLHGMLSLIMPAYNEGERIYQNVLRAYQQVKEMADRVEIIVVDDGSSDNTFAEIERASKELSAVIPLALATNSGKGKALKHGTAYAKGDYIAFCDSDLELPPEQLWKFIDIMFTEHADVVIGSKMHKDSDLVYPLIRRIYSLGYYCLLRLLFNLKVKDTQTGLKLFKASIIKPVMEKIRVNGYAFDIEVLAVINSMGYSIASAPIRLVFQRNGFGRIGIKDVYDVLIDTFAVFYRLRTQHSYDVSMRKSEDDRYGSK